MAFESDIRAGASEVYLHGMPGGQYTNLREQARSLGIDEHRWPEVARAYADVNQMFGDIVKVTPTSKVVGDMAIFMVTSGLTRAQVDVDPGREVAFPESVVQLFRGDIGQPLRRLSGGPAAQGAEGRAQPLTGARASVLPPADLAAERAAAEIKSRGARSPTPNSPRISCTRRCSSTTPRDRGRYGDLACCRPPVFFYGMAVGRGDVGRPRAWQDADRALVAISEAHEDGTRTVFFELNGQPRSIRVADRSQVAKRAAAAQGRDRQSRPGRRADAGNGRHGRGAVPARRSRAATRS